MKRAALVIVLWCCACRTSAPVAPDPPPAEAAPADAFAAAEAWLASEHGLTTWTLSWIERMRCVPDGECSALAAGEGDPRTVRLRLRRGDTRWEVASADVTSP